MIEYSLIDRTIRYFYPSRNKRRSIFKWNAKGSIVLSIFYKKNKAYFALLTTTLLLTIVLFTAPYLHDFFTKLLNIASYIVWHNLFEFSSIIISICIFCVSYYSFEQNRNFRYLFLGNMLLLMGLIDFFHAMSFKGMPDFLIANATSNRATTFWIIARLIGGFGMLIASMIPLQLKFRFNKLWFFVLPVGISLLILNLVTYHPGFLPPMYIEGTGLSEIKIKLEFVVIFLMLFAVIFLLSEFKKNKDRFSIILSCAILIGIYSELAFTLYVDVYGLYNFLGHLLKFIMYFIIFRVVFVQSIKQPYQELTAAKDELKNYADNLDRIVEQRTEQINLIHQNLLDDLEYARDIQRAMLPKSLPNIAVAAFESCYFPAERVSGDFYNVFRIDESKIGLYIGDVSGHGVSAAMLTVFLNQSIQSKKENQNCKKETLLPSDVLKNIYLDFNRTDFKSEVYIVMLYGILDLETKEFTFASAGLNVPPLVVDSSGKVTELNIKGFPICKLPNNYDVAYQNSTIQLGKGDKVLFYTDGLIEAANQHQIVYSDLRLKEQLHKNWSLNALQLTEHITDNVFQFIENDGKLKDDITFFVMEMK